VSDQDMETIDILRDKIKEYETLLVVAHTIILDINATFKIDDEAINNYLKRLEEHGISPTKTIMGSV